MSKNRFSNIDCMIGMAEYEDNHFDLAIVDPPYNIGKAKWDKVDNYINWLGGVLLEIQRVSKDNSSMYLFHNDIMQLKDIMGWIESKSNFIYKQFITWNKRFVGGRNKGYLDGYVEVEGLRNYQQLAEYILYYTFQNQTGLTTIMLDTNNFSSLRKYFKDFQKDTGMNIKQINKRFGDRRSEHSFYWDSTQWDLPTREVYNRLLVLPQLRGFNRRTWESLRQEYESLRQEYESQRYTFNNQKTHHSVWDYDFVSCNWHPTPKPKEVIKNIILHSSNQDDKILDCFAGTGVVNEACLELDREYTGFELDEEYYNAAQKRLTQFRLQLKLAI